MSVGSRISELRKEHHISQGQLAKDLDISRQAVSKWENDQSSPDTVNLIKLAEILETEVEYLVTGRKPVYEPAPVVINLVDKSDTVPEKVIIREVPKRVLVKQRPNPLFWIGFGGGCFTLGLVLGLFL